MLSSEYKFICTTGNHGGHKYYIANIWNVIMNAAIVVYT